MNKYNLPGLNIPSNHKTYCQNIIFDQDKSSTYSVKDDLSMASESIGSTLSELVKGMHMLKINLVDQG